MTPRLSDDAHRALLVGFLLALLFTLIPFTRLLFFPLISIIHEMGHAATAWAFGYPALPAFDFAEGGGVTSMLERVPLLLVIPYLLFAFAAWKVKAHAPTLIALLVLALIYSRLAFTGKHQALILMMGHGTELVMVAVFLHRAMSGTKLLQADERPAYAMCGFLIWFHDLQFSSSLVRNREALESYVDGKSSVENDFVALAADHLNMPVSRIALLFFLATLATPFLPRILYGCEGLISTWRMKLAKD